MNNYTSAPWENIEYGSSLVNVSVKGNDIYIISDLHIASGLNTSSNYQGTENFFADDSFVRFLDHLQSKKNSSKALLIINGDLIDFLRIVNIPVFEDDFTAWQQMLQMVGISKSISELKQSIVKKEITYGLKTHNFKSVWKLDICIRGHSKLFQRLAQWLSDGNDLIITKGNHDLEWYWKEVRSYLQYWLGNCIAKQQGAKTEEIISTIILPQTLFIDDSLVVDDKIFVKHGHSFENMTSVKGDPLIGNKEELNIPLGSFFNRYLINRIELSYPYLDNVKPTQNILLVLFRERFPFAIMMLWRYLWLMWLLIQKKIFWETLKYLFTFLLIIVIPVGITAYAILHSRPSPTATESTTPFIVKQLLSVAKNLGFLFLSYVFARIMTAVKLKGPNSFYADAQNILNTNDQIEIVTFGHTHNPEQISDHNKWYFNTGTWIPIYESTSSDVRMDKTYTFLQISKDDKGNFKAMPLQRWNDDALRDDALSLNEKK